MTEIQVDTSRGGYEPDQEYAPRNIRNAATGVNKQVWICRILMYSQNKCSY